ncbi:MAG: phage tail tape measure protein [Pseudomonadota bacterium]
MADATRVIDLIFNGVDRTGAATDAVLRNTRDFSGNIQAATQPLTDFTVGALQFEAALLAAGTAFAGFAINEAASFEAALAELNKVLSETEPLERYADLSRDLGREYGVAIEQVVASIADFRQAGFTAEEAGNLTETALQAVVAGGVDAATASDLLVASLKGFGAEASESTRIVDLLNAVSNEYATNFGELLTGFARFSPVAKTVGLSLEETAAILTPGIEVFRSGSEAANALRTVFLRLSDDSKPVQEALDAIGVSQRDSNNELRSGRDIFFDVAEALSSVDSNQRAFIASQLAGIERSGQFLATVEGLDRTLRIAGDGFDFLGSAAAEVEIRLATAEVAAARTAVSFNDLLIGIGTPLLDEFSDVANGITAIFDAIGESLDDGQLQEITGFFERELSGLSEVLEGIAEALPEALGEADLSGFITGLEAVREAISSLFGDLDLTEADDLARAIEFVGQSFNGLSQFSAGAIESFGPLFRFFAKLAEDATESGEALRGIGQAFGVASQINQFSTAIGGATTAVQVLVGLLAANQGITLARSLSGVAAALAGPSGLIAGLTTLAGFSSFKIFEQLNKLPEVGGFDRISTNIGDLAARFTGLRDEAEKLTETEFFPQSLSRFEVEAEGVVRGLTDIARSIAGIDDSVQTTQLDNFVERLNQAGETDLASRLNAEFQVFKQTGDIIEDLDGKFGEFQGTLLEYPSDIRPAVDALEGIGSDGANLTGYFSVVSSGAESAAASVEKVVNASAGFSNDTFVAAIESAAAIDVARIEANAQQIVAAFSSIDNTVSVTGNSIQELFGLLGDDNISKFDRLSLKQQIDAENDRLDKQLNRQGRLIDAQIRNLNAQTDALRSDDALIKIDGAGLQPHLEAFMFEILDSIQVRVSGQGGRGLLLGLGG